MNNRSHISVYTLLQTVDGVSCLTSEESASIQTPNSNENCSFDSALQMSEDFYVPSSQGWKGNESENVIACKGGPDFKHAPPLLKSTTSASQASLSSGSISDKNGGDHGFSCDSPEGGTIKKKPNPQTPVSALKSSSNAPNTSKPPENTNGML